MTWKWRRDVEVEEGKGQQDERRHGAEKARAPTISFIHLYLHTEPLVPHSYMVCAWERGWVQHGGDARFFFRQSKRGDKYMHVCFTEKDIVKGYSLGGF